MATFDQMSDEEWLNFRQQQLVFFQSSIPPKSSETLKNKWDRVVPAGCISVINAQSEYVSATVEAMIEIAVGTHTSKFNIPLSILLKTTRSSLAKDAAALPRNIFKIGIHTMVLTRLAAHALVHEIQVALTSTQKSRPKRLEVVFCILPPEVLNA